MDNKGFFDFFFYIIIWLSVAEFAIQLAISDLSAKVKESTALQQPYRFNSLCRFKFWRKLFGKAFGVLSPLLLIVVLFFNIHRFFSEMFDCPYCICAHLCWLTNWLYLDMDIITSIMLAPIGLVFVAVLDRLHSH